MLLPSLLPLQVVEEEMVAVEEAMVAEAAPETEAEVKVKDKQVGYFLAVSGLRTSFCFTARIDVVNAVMS